MGFLSSLFTGGMVPEDMVKEKVTGPFSKIRKEYPGRVLETSNQLREGLDEYAGTGQGVRKGLAKFSDLADMFGDQANKSYLDTTEGMAFSRQLDQTSDRRANRLRNDVSLMGLTPEAYLAGLNDINQAEGQSFSNLVSGSDARRRGLRSQQMQALSQVLGGESDLYQTDIRKFLSALQAGTGIQGQGQALQGQSNQNIANLFGGLVDSLIPLGSNK